MRVVRIRQLPALEAALARFDTWWQGLTRRERILLATLAVLLGVVVLVYGVIKPIQSAHAEAVADIRSYETLNARILAAGRLNEAPVTQRGGTPESIVAAAASAAGISVATEPRDGVVAARATGVGYDVVLRWIDDIARTSDLSVKRADIVHGEAAGTVDVSVEFAR